MKKEFLPVDPDYYDMLEKESEKNSISVLHYFDQENKVQTVRGIPEVPVMNSLHEVHLEFSSGELIRIDRIITINGRPGPAYDEYDGYALACLDCMGGMD